MKTIFQNSPLITSEGLESSIMGMDSNGMEQACYFLRDKIYSDKIAAVVREYACNAVDEHVKYNINVPVKITLKNCIFSVRDFAKGLSENDVRNIFGMYFKSTKTSSNNQIGGFGIGAKSAFCYTDSFTVKSFYQEICTTYICSLGAGQSGASVGQILKMAEEPCDESGLEISLEIKSDDECSFNSTIHNFVKTSIKNIIYENPWNEKIVPSEYVKKIDFENFSIRLYKEEGYIPYNIIYKMGDIQYKTSNVTDLWSENTNFHRNIRLIPHHYLVIDVDIGCMSLPISRENFENTSKNQEFLKYIQERLTEFVKKDFEQFQNYSVEQIYKEISSSLISSEFFCLNKQIVYGDVYKALTNLGYTGYSDPPLMEKTKKVVCIIQDKESFSYWIEKLTQHCFKNLQSQCLYINEKYLVDSQVKETLEQIFFFKKIKSSYFKWKKIPKNGADFDAEYRVTLKNDIGVHSSKFYTALELHNEILRKFKMQPVETKQAALESFQKIVLKTRDDLNLITIHHGAPSYGHGLTAFTQSQKMVDNLLQIGWYQSYSTEWNKKAEEFRQIKLKELERDKKINSCRIDFLQTNYRFDNRIIRKDKYFSKISKIIENIKNENSLRAKIFNSLYAQYNYSYNKGLLTRKQLRQILTLKD